jgi:hypothetical protein
MKHSSLIVTGLVAAGIFLSAGAASAATPTPAPTPAPTVLSAKAAASTPVPADVQAWFASNGLTFAKTIFAPSSSTASADGSDTSMPDYSSATGLGPVHPLYAWSSNFIAGTPTANILAPEQEWVAVIQGPSGPLGVVSAIKESPTGPVEGGITGDVSIAKDLTTVAAGSVVEDASSGEWFTVSGSSVSALNTAATLEVPSTEPLTSFQTVVAKRYAVRSAEANALVDPIGGNGALSDLRPWYERVDPLQFGISAGIALIGLALVFWLVRSRLRERRAR